jgi:hypothetical protein
MDDKKKEILQTAEHALHYTELLIQQCDSWLPAEEGNQEMIKRIEEKRKKELTLQRTLNQKTDDKNNCR